MEQMFSNLARVAIGFAFASVYGEPLNLDRRRRSDAIFDLYGREKMRSPNKLNLKSNFKFWLSILYECESPYKFEGRMHYLQIRMGFFT